MRSPYQLKPNHNSDMTYCLRQIVAVNLTDWSISSTSSSPSSRIATITKDVVGGRSLSRHHRRLVSVGQGGRHFPTSPGLCSAITGGRSQWGKTVDTSPHRPVSVAPSPAAGLSGARRSTHPHIATGTRLSAS